MKSDYASTSTNPSSSDWSLLFGNVEEDSVHRSASLGETEEPEFTTCKQIPQKKFPQTQLEVESPQVRNVQSLAFLTRFVMCKQHVSISMLFEFMVSFFLDNDQTRKNLKFNERTSTIIGCVFSGSQQAHYRVQLFSFEKNLGVSLDITDGFSPAIQEMWKSLTQSLQTSDLVECNEVESDFEDFNDLYSEDEDDAPLEDFDYIKLDNHPALVKDLINDLNDPNFMQHTLLLLAFNCQLDRNFQEIVGDASKAQQLFDTIIACMISTAADFCLPIARCASLLISQLVESGSITVNEEQFNVLVQALVQWTLDQGNQQDQDKLTQSEEVATLLSSQVKNLATLAETAKAELRQVYQDAPYDIVRENLSDVILAY
jgi:hypothetical protein